MNSSIAKLRLVFLGTVANLALAGTAAAQTTPSPDQNAQGAASIEEVQVTGTRIVRQGFVAPTPVTTMTTQDLQIGGYTEIGQALDDLPMAKPTLSPLQTANGEVYQGFNIPDLRGLGAARTLVLVDGERPIWDSIVGVDLNSIPISLVKRVDVVTGGASAAYGSDAVSGVINIVLDNDFVGERANAQYGEDGQGYGGNYKASVAFGTNFGADDRGHFMIAGEWTHSDLITMSSCPPDANKRHSKSELRAGQRPVAISPGTQL